MARAAPVVCALVLVFLTAACAEDGSPSPAVDLGATCEELAEDVAKLAMDLADHASSEGSFPIAALDVEHPDELDVWEAANAMARGSSELERRVDELVRAKEEAGCEPGWAHETVEQRTERELASIREQFDEEDFDREAYTAANLLAVITANLAAPLRFEVPEGFPEQFPVHPDARLDTSEQQQDGAVSATWTIEGTPFEQVSDYYTEHLQELRFGGWNVPSSSGSGGAGAEAVAERTHLEVEGYGYTGEAIVESAEPAAPVVVRATLKPA